MISGISPAPIPPLFGVADCDRAYEAWGCNCGPAALAAICGLTLDESLGVLPAFVGKGYTNPSMMFHALARTGRIWGLISAEDCFPSWGLVRVQWEGPWTKPGVPMRARYRYTHWIGACRRQSDGEFGVFDINCLTNGSGWVALEHWREIIAPHLISLYPRASGSWRVTHTIEVAR